MNRATASADVRDREIVLRRFRDRILPASDLGVRLASFVRERAPQLTNALLADEEAFGLAARLLDRWARRITLEILEAEVDADTVETAHALADRLAQLHPELGEEIGGLKANLEEFEGRTVRSIFLPDAGTRRSAR